MKTSFLTIPIFILTAISLFTSCSKSNNSSSANNPSSIYSDWRISNSTVAEDNDYFNSHPLGTQSAIYSEGRWYSSNKYFMVNGYVESSNGQVQKLTYALVSFASKPTSSMVYHIGTSGNLNASECYIRLNGSRGNDYRALTLGQPVDVTVNNGSVSISFTNLSLTVYDSWSNIIGTANATGKVVEGY